MNNEPLNYDSAAALSDFLHNLNLGARKRWGQNFLVNRGARQKILAGLDIKPGDQVWEIGPGLGAMTVMALAMDADVKVFEIDPAYQNILEEFYGSNGHFSLVRGDVLKTWDSVPMTEPVKILGNLPYNIAAAIIQNFLTKPVSLAVVTVQKEMADRMLAKVRTKDYSSFSIWCQSHFDMKNLGTLKPGSFYPAPHVDSAIVKMVRKKEFSSDFDRFFDVLIKSAFAGRRKTIKNNWQNATTGTFKPYQLTYDMMLPVMAEEGILEGMRAEEIEASTYVSLAHKIFPLVNKEKTAL